MLSDASGMSGVELQESLKSITDKLFAYRDKRVHPFKDDKILNRLERSHGSCIGKRSPDIK